MAWGQTMVGVMIVMATVSLTSTGFKQYMNWEFPDVQVDLEKAEEPEMRLPMPSGSLKKQESSRKTSTSALLTMPKPLTVWITKNCGKFFKRWEYQTTLLASWEICVQVKKQQLEPDLKQTGSRSRKEYIMWNTGLDEVHAEIKTAGRNIKNLWYADDMMIQL